MNAVRRLLIVLALLTAPLAATPANAAEPTPTSTTPASTTPATTRPVDPVAHDPTMAEENGWHYVVITGDAQRPGTYLPIKRSRDLIHWQEIGPAFTALPTWVTDQLGTTPADAWGPSLTRTGHGWALYYAVSQFGTQNSVIGLATSPTLDPNSPAYKWTDRGMVLRSTPGQDDFNAIDPDYVTDGKGGAWLAFGSFWGGIKMRRLDPATGMLSAGDQTTYSLAERVSPDAEEGPAILHRGAYFYLFLSFDFCCRGTESDYRMVVGRSTSVTGPYLDRDGVPLTAGGGTEVLRGYNEFVGTGGGDVWSDGRHTYLVNHYYDVTDNGTPRLNVRPVAFRDGWPAIEDPVDASRAVGHGDAFVRLVERTTGLPVADVGCGYEGAGIALVPDGPATCAQWQYSDRGNGTSSLLGRFSNKVAEVAACDNVDGGRVAQWGWIGFLGSNDCQRWRTAPTEDGWTRVESVLPGSRALDAAGCAAGTDIVITAPGTGTCQEFRFEPVGPVLLIGTETGTAATVLGGPACPPGATGASNGRCREWKFTPAGGAEYTITDIRTRQYLGSCGDNGLGLAGPAAKTCATRWTLVPQAGGVWSLSLTGTAVAATIRLRQP